LIAQRGQPDGASARSRGTPRRSGWSRRGQAVAGFCGILRRILQNSVSISRNFDFSVSTPASATRPPRACRAPAARGYACFGTQAPVGDTFRRALGE